MIVSTRLGVGLRWAGGGAYFLIDGSQGQIQEAGRARLGRRARELATTARRPTSQVHAQEATCPP
eukprot:8577702-Pyramimonas_sp.AAC.1